MKSVIEFAENALKNCHDTYGPSPLFADGINVFTGEHVKWVMPGGEEAVVCDLACQQNFFRTLTALSIVTGDEKYKNAAKAAIKYCFDNFTDKSGLIFWGGHRFIDLAEHKSVGAATKNMVHELKNAFPFYELMFEVDPQATEKYIKAFWNAHVYDWDELHTGRHGEYNLDVGDVWGHELVNKPALRESTGLSFINCGNDLIYSAGLLYKYSRDFGAFKWAKHLASQYVAARNPDTGLGAYQFTQPLKRMDTDDPNITLSWYGDRCKRQFGPEFGDIALEANVLFSGKTTYAPSIYCENALMQLELANQIGSEAKWFLDVTTNGLLSFAKYAYEPKTNEIKPMFTDGKDLTGFVYKRNGYYGKAGTILTRAKADGQYLLSYAKAYLYSGNEELWNIARSIAKGNNLGDLGTASGNSLDLNLNTSCSDPVVLIALLEIYKATKKTQYLDLGKELGKNIEKKHFNNGYFTKTKTSIYAQLDAVEPLALTYLQAAMENKLELMPMFINGHGFIQGEYQMPDGSTPIIKDDYFYSLEK